MVVSLEAAREQISSLSMEDFGNRLDRGSGGYLEKWQVLRLWKQRSQEWVEMRLIL